MRFTRETAGSTASYGTGILAYNGGGPPGHAFPGRAWERKVTSYLPGMTGREAGHYRGQNKGPQDTVLILFQIVGRVVSDPLVLQHMECSHPFHMQRTKRSQRDVHNLLAMLFANFFPFCQQAVSWLHKQYRSSPNILCPQPRAAHIWWQTKSNSGSVQMSNILKGGYDITKPPCSIRLMPGPTICSPGKVE